MFACSPLAVRRQERERMGSICQGGYFNCESWLTIMGAGRHLKSAGQGRAASWDLKSAGYDGTLGPEVCRAGQHAGT